MTTTTQDMMDIMMKNKKQDEQRYKDDLIEKATMRLRRRLLEQQLSEVMHNVIQMQSQLEVLRVDTSATIDAVANIQQDEQYNRLESLERRLNAHQKQLNQLVKQAVTTEQQQPEDDDDNTVAVDCNTTTLNQKPTAQAFSMSRLSSLSLMSSLFSRTSTASTRATSRALSDTASCYNDDQTVEDEDDDDCMSVASSMMSDTPEARQRRHRRRRRVKHHRQAHRMRTDDVTELKWSQKAPTLFPLPEQPHTMMKNTDNDYTCSSYLDHPNLTLNQYNYDNSNNSKAQEEDTLSDIGSMSTASTMSHPRAIYDMLDHHREFLKNNLSSFQGHTRFDDYLNDNDDDGTETTTTTQQQQEDATYEKNPYATAMMAAMQRGDRPRHPLSPLSENFFRENASSFAAAAVGLKDYYDLDCNVLDDALSFLDSMSVDDDGFGEDMEFLLQHPDLCCRPLDEVRTTMIGHTNYPTNDDDDSFYFLQQQQRATTASLYNSNLRRQRHRQHQKVTIPSALYHYGMRWMSSMGYSACMKSVRWCKFLSILFAAMMVSILKGPQDVLDVY
ncbi:hypothetical protein BDA99DRAFT_537510 [Phascolomyces articulosus]|uniref:Uncharacterized protein n=1 Tax=Phascolomyces articulosus TaxID=60185 RepID=A0AAD5KCM6_9FUNG|nr:hypothetical protein BDA99DRAFT_537510 [Phascolomyces articulosus]